MDVIKYPALLGLAASTSLLTLNLGSTFAFEKPIHTAIFFLAIAGAAIQVLSHVISRYGHRDSKSEHAYDAIPLDDKGQHVSEVDQQNQFPFRWSTHLRLPHSLRQVPILLFILAGAISLRVELSREILRHVECIRPSLHPLIPLAFAIYERWTARSIKDPQPALDIEPQGPRRLLCGRYLASPGSQSLASAFLVSFGGLYAIWSATNARSTYICATSSEFIWLVPLLHNATVALDVLILYCVSNTLLDNEQVGRRALDARLRSISFAILTSASFLLLISIIYLLATPSDRLWVITLPAPYLWSCLKIGIIVAITTICMLPSIFHLGSSSTTLIITLVVAATLTTSSAITNMHGYMGTSPTGGLFALIIAVFGFCIWFNLEGDQSNAHTKRRLTVLSMSSLLYFSLTMLLLFHLFVWYRRDNTTPYHPVDVIIMEAQSKHQAWAKHAKSSNSLDGAVDVYLQRYGRHPPPRFDAWYNYATQRHSPIIDDFDSIHRDLAPFYSLTPAELRERTWRLASDPRNDMAAISVRNGAASIGSYIMPTHRWMLAGTRTMIDKFAEFLPDMDIAFNLNDIPRVAVHHEDLQSMRERELSFNDDTATAHNRFDMLRATQWRTFPNGNESADSYILQHHKLEDVFRNYGSMTCPPNSPARNQRIWNARSRHMAYETPHSMGGFLSDWTLAGSVCHQPDMANLHGFYLAPGAMKATHELYPVFSQSKVSGFNDILYPSPWNYIDKSVYAPDEQHEDPPFEAKKHQIFWRGTTSEGMSVGMGEWRGMSRQRFVHLANNIKDTSPRPAMLLPTRKDAEKLAFESVPAHDITNLITTDIQITPDIFRCGVHDCAQQRWEFAPVSNRTDFQGHWEHKYLLDLDGAGFSGRFLPFLHSRSLPFKVGIFREWWHDRVTPWLHFVPLDLRGHGFWSTLAYFAGLEGKVGNRWLKLGAHETEAEFIAREGREWAGSALRKEDMEIYMFRLLLEWARLTDDMRDEIGFNGTRTYW